MKTVLRARKAIAASVWAALLLGLAPGACDRDRPERDPTTPSGFTVPRYMILRYDEINGRAGPSEDHEVLWTYRAQGLPVQVIAEIEGWRRICDPEGGISWVAQRMVTFGPSVMRAAPGDILLRRRPQEDAVAAGRLSQNAVAEILNERNGWLEVRAGRTRGWVRSEEVWGAQPGFQCEGLPAPDPTLLTE